MNQLSNKEFRELLRPGKANELKPGGVWYYREQNGSFRRVVSDKENLVKEGYREFVINASKFGMLYLNVEFPNYSITTSSHKRDYERMKEHEIQPEQPNRPREIQEEV